mgnify:CR=1 FL=1
MSYTRTRTSVLESEKHNDDNEFERQTEQELQRIQEAESNLRKLGNEGKVADKDKTQFSADNDAYKSNVITVRLQEKKAEDDIDFTNDVDLVALSRSNFNKFMNRYDVTFE